MAEIKQSKTTEAKIHSRLSNQPSGRTPHATTETYPTRTITNVYASGFQAQRGDVVKTGDDQ